MLDTQFASANTTIRIKEQEFLTVDQWEQLLRCDHLEQALTLLKNTVYADVSVNFENDLLDKQVALYTDLQTLVPDEQLYNIFSLPYVYHNLKILTKEHLTGLSLRHLIIPIGHYKVDALEQLVKTRQSDELPDILVDRVTAVIDNFTHYENVQSIDLLYDEGYFEHVLWSVQQLNDATLEHVVRSWIDVFNVSTVLRLSVYKMSRSQLHLMLCEGGHLSLKEVIRLAMVGQLNELVEQLKTTEFGGVYSTYTTEELLQSSVIEKMQDKITHTILQEARFEAFGFLPFLAFVFYKEMEFKNLRLILTGKENQMDTALLRERMKPIYGA